MNENLLTPDEETIEDFPGVTCLRISALAALTINQGKILDLEGVTRELIKETRERACSGSTDAIRAEAIRLIMEWNNAVSNK